MSIDEIREAKDELIRMTNNPEERALYDMRAKILKDKISELNAAMREGERNKAIEIARNLLDILDDEIIANKTGLDIEIIKRLRK